MNLRRGAAADSSIIKCGVSAVMYAARRVFACVCVCMCAVVRSVSCWVNGQAGADKDKTLSGPCRHFTHVYVCIGHAFGFVASNLGFSVNNCVSDTFTPLLICIYYTTLWNNDYGWSVVSF